MPGNRAEVLVAQTTGILQYTGSGTQHLIQTPAGVIYCFYVDSGSDLAFRKSSNGGFTWSNPVVVFTGTVTSFSVWYDRWSGIDADLIHCAYTESVTDDTLYRTVNPASGDALSTQTVIFAGASTGTGDGLSITRAQGGNVYCHTNIDGGTEGGFYRLPNANVPNGAWDAARTLPEALAANDQYFLAPGFAADTQDILALFWDHSANTISRYVYDDSANTWAKTTVSASMSKLIGSNGFPFLGMAVDLANSQLIVGAWSAIDTANADLRCWTVNESAITEVTNIVLNSTDDQGLCAIALATDTGHWHAFYVGKSDGSETWSTAVRVYTKVSTDAGTTWGPETQVSNTTYSIGWIASLNRFTGNPVVAFHNNIALDEINVSVLFPRRRAAHQMYGG